MKQSVYLAAARFESEYPYCYSILTMVSAFASLEEKWSSEAPLLLSAFKSVDLWKPNSLAHFFSGNPPTIQDVQDLVTELVPGTSEDDLDYYAPYVLEAVAVSRDERRRADYARAVVPVWEIAAEDLRRKRERESPRSTRSCSSGSTCRRCIGCRPRGPRCHVWDR